MNAANPRRFHALRQAITGLKSRPGMLKNTTIRLHWTAISI
jgi:hypothetical protein